MKKVVLAALALALVVLSTACESTGRPEAETWAFCGVHPGDPLAQKKAVSMRVTARIDATFGPCLDPDWSTYSPAFPGQRYLDPQGYEYLVALNANAGMKTIVYDARIWSDDPIQRRQAIEFWSPHLAWIRAWDMGDEFDPASDEWPILIHRWNIVLEHVTPETGVGPFTNHLPWALDEALRDLPSQRAHLSYDRYVVSESLELAEEFDPQVAHLMCAINLLDHGDYRPTTWGIETSMLDHRDAGCDSFLIFGGEMPIDPTGYFVGTSLVNPDGTATLWAEAVARGAR